MHGRYGGGMTRLTKTPMTLAIAYYRVSTRRQGESGLGLEGQRAAVQPFAAARGLTLIEEVVEVETGTGKRNRPGLNAALEKARQTGAVLLIAKLDRLSRNVAFVSALMESGVKFVAVDMPEVDDLTVYLVAAMAQREAALVSTRTRAALSAAKARGVKLGTVQNLTAEGRDRGREVQREGARRAERGVAGYVSLLRRDGLSLARIASRLMAEGHTSRTGRRLTPMHIKRILDRSTSN